VTHPAPIVSVSVDLDSIACYWRIHALDGTQPEETRHSVLRKCLPRFAELFTRQGVRATFFVVGEDLVADAEGRALLAALARDGHELASHTFSHPYDLVRLSAHRIADEIDRAHAVIAETAGAPPVGFRAPGYEITETVLQTLVDRGYAYDSSVFPAVPYYLAKAAIMAGMRLLGRTSGSILGSPRVLRAPTAPYRPDLASVYQTGTSPIVELPITVLPWTRVPVIGTAIVMAPEMLRYRLVQGALGLPFFNFELHGIDLADASGDGLPSVLIGKQPDLGRPLGKKLAALESTLIEARNAGARFMPLRDAAQHFGKR
jgi:peptidoglycan-N-acetylglucosamine deacetylase